MLNEFSGTFSDSYEQIDLLLCVLLAIKVREPLLIGLVGKPLQIQILCIDIDGAWHIALDGLSYSLIQDVIDRQTGSKRKEQDDILGPGCF